jgi:hypothetical protein
MNRLLYNAVKASLLFFSISTFAAIDNPQKIGIGSWEFNSSDDALRAVENYGFGWYYTWRTTPLWGTNTSPARTVPFVPMIWDEAHVNDVVPTTAGVVLGYNEPDNSVQANMTVEQAISLWPKLVGTGLRTGSPATTYGQTLGADSWLGRFMAQADTRGYQVDFITVHYYNANKDVAAFKAYLEAIYATYKRPIWVTEWALVDWKNPGRYSLEENALFAQQALEMLDDLPYVERHAWFSAYNSGEGLNTQIFDKNNNPTVIGNVFYQALRGNAGTPTPVPAALNLVLNPGFESGSKNWTNWGNSAAVKSDAVGGSYSLRVGTGAGGRHQKVALSPNQAYALTAKTKGETGHIGVTFRDSAGTIVKEFSLLSGSTTYQTISLDIVAPPAFSYAEVWAYKDSGTAYMYVDDFVLKPR